MNIYVIIVVTAFIVGAAVSGGLLLYLRNKKIVAGEETAELATRYNWEIERYNTVNKLFRTLVREKSDAAEKTGNTDVLSKISFITSDFIEATSAADKASSRVNTEFNEKKNNNIKVLSEACSSMEQAIDEMEFMAEDLKRLDPGSPAPASKPEQGRLESVMDDPFFYGCDTQESVAQRFKALAKVLHPDGKTGNTEMFKVLQHEYNKRKR